MQGGRKGVGISNMVGHGRVYVHYQNGPLVCVHDRLGLGLNLERVYCARGLVL